MPMKKHKPEQIVSLLEQLRRTQRYEMLYRTDEGALTRDIVAGVVARIRERGCPWTDVGQN